MQRHIKALTPHQGRSHYFLNNGTECFQGIDSSVLVWQVPANRLLYRGLGGVLLPDRFWKDVDGQDFRGGVEFGLMSTTTDRFIAVQYSGVKVRSTALSAWEPPLRRAWEIRPKAALKPPQGRLGGLSRPTVLKPRQTRPRRRLGTRVCPCSRACRAPWQVKRGIVFEIWAGTVDIGASIRYTPHSLSSSVQIIKVNRFGFCCEYSLERIDTRTLNALHY